MNSGSGAKSAIFRHIFALRQKPSRQRKKTVTQDLIDRRPDHRINRKVDNGTAHTRILRLSLHCAVYSATTLCLETPHTISLQKNPTVDPDCPVSPYSARNRSSQRFHLRDRWRFGYLPSDTPGTAEQSAGSCSCSSDAMLAFIFVAKSFANPVMRSIASCCQGLATVRCDCKPRMFCCSVIYISFDFLKRRRMRLPT